MHPPAFGEAYVPELDSLSSRMTSPIASSPLIKFWMDEPSGVPLALKTGFSLFFWTVQREARDRGHTEDTAEF
jgi:hypothetical protein